ncbi:MAG: chemotaxis protein CheW [Sporomusaceae bacterium]|nr:chemotaxis protein CheW [Sporomusaceae bacterium]
MTEEFAAELEAEDTQKDKYLTFSLGAEAYGIEIQYVTEIVGMQTITGLPDLPDYAKGIINLRGNIIPVIDMRLRFKKSSVEINDRTCVIIVDIKGIAVGLLVDTVAEVLNIAEADIVPPPQLNNGYQQRFIKAIGKVGDAAKLILDCDRILTADEVNNLSDLKDI